MKAQHSKTSDELKALTAELSDTLGYKTPPCFISPREVENLGVATCNTLAVWRSSGRYNLPYVKMSRRVKYRLTDIAQHLMSRTVTHTGQLEG